MSSRREFISGLSLLGLGSQLSCTSSSFAKAKPSDFWDHVKSQFTKPQNGMLNLNSGSSSNMPLPILQKYIEYTKEVNAYAPYEVLKSWGEEIALYKQSLSKLIGAEEGSLTYVFNTTSALNTIISGLNLGEGDEVITSSSDYPFANYTWKNKEKKNKVVLNKLMIDCKNISDDEIIAKFKSALTNKTKVIYLTYITHREGHIYPIQQICKLAKEHNIATVVDGAHAIGQIDFNLKDLGCDYFATSMHKWMNAPLGSGLLYVRNEKVKNIQPIKSYPENLLNDPLKFSHLGTRAFQNEITVGACLEFLSFIGIERKQNRFNTLKNYWIDKVQDHPNITIKTDPDRSCGVASLMLKTGKSFKALKKLKSQYNIHLKSPKDPISGEVMLRVSPEISTSFAELDYFIESIIAVAES